MKNNKLSMGKKAQEKAEAAETLQADPLHQMGDEEMTVEIKNLHRNAQLFKYLLYGCAFLGVIVVVSAGMLPGIILLLVTCIPVALIQGSYETKLKNYVADNIVRQALEDVFDNITYDPEKRIDDSYIRNCQLGLPRYDEIRGDDYVKGTYKGLNIEMSDITLIVEDVTQDEDGNEQRSERPVFQGLWMVCDFGKELAADMRIMQKGRSLLRDRGIKTENEQFNKKFHIESAIEQEAFYILTPHMMEYILEMTKKAGGVTRICFARGGKVQITIDSGRNAFEVGRGEADATVLRKKFVREIRYVTDIIDELRLVDTLYKR